MTAVPSTSGSSGARQQQHIHREITIQLEDRELWRVFSRNGITNEMIITKAGRRMFPVVRVRVHGLQPRAMYNIVLDFVQNDDFKWKYTDGRWTKTGKAEPQPNLNIFMHPDSPNFGEKWMRESICFSKLKFTNKDNDKGWILLNSMHHYQPVVKLYQIDPRNHEVAQTPVATFAFTECQFIAVTSYQNEEVTELKIKHNPFAKGFQDHQRATVAVLAPYAFGQQNNHTGADKPSFSSGSHSVPNTTAYGNCNKHEAQPMSFSNSERQTFFPTSCRALSSNIPLQQQHYQPSYYHQQQQFFSYSAPALQTGGVSSTFDDRYLSFMDGNNNNNNNNICSRYYYPYDSQNNWSPPRFDSSRKVLLSDDEQQRSGLTVQNSVDYTNNRQPPLRPALNSHMFQIQQQFPTTFAALQNSSSSPSVTSYGHMQHNNNNNNSNNSDIINNTQQQYLRSVGVDYAATNKEGVGKFATSSVLHDNTRYHPYAAYASLRSVNSAAQNNNNSNNNNSIMSNKNNAQQQQMCCSLPATTQQQHARVVNDTAPGQNDTATLTATGAVDAPRLSTSNDDTYVNDVNSIITTNNTNNTYAASAIITLADADSNISTASTSSLSSALMQPQNTPALSTAVLAAVHEGQEDERPIADAQRLSQKSEPGFSKHSTQTSTLNQALSIISAANDASSVNWQTKPFDCPSTATFDAQDDDFLLFNAQLALGTANRAGTNSHNATFYNAACGQPDDTLLSSSPNKQCSPAVVDTVECERPSVAGSSATKNISTLTDITGICRGGDTAFRVRINDNYKRQAIGDNIKSPPATTGEPKR